MRKPDLEIPAIERGRTGREGDESEGGRGGAGEEAERGEGVVLSAKRGSGSGRG